MRIAALLLFPAEALAFEISAGPDTYQSALVILGPGDELTLDPGTYRDCLVLDGLHGAPDEPIVIRGPADRSARFVGDRCDGWTNRYRVIVKIEDSSHLVVENLEIDGRGLEVDGVEAGYGDTPVHHITLRNLYIHDNGVSNQQNGISCFATAWDWTIENNRIARVGTGLYLGNSTGADPFIRGVIRNNLVENTLGYGMQIKHQLGRPHHTGMPGDGSITTIRGNVFVKEIGASHGDEARPSLLLGHLPLEGVGSNDRYLVEGNTFFENESDDEPLVQVEGNVILRRNVFVNSHAGPGLHVRPHNDVPKEIEIVENTFLTSGAGIVVEGPSPLHRQSARGNAVYSDAEAIAGIGGDNFTASLTHAAFLISSPSFDLAGLDVTPLPGWASWFYGASHASDP